MERRFDEELMGLKKTLLAMGDESCRMVGEATRGLLERRVEAGGRVHALEERVNRLEGEVEEEVLRLLARRQPAAGDLRFLLGALMIARDLERVGDQACNLSETAAYLAQQAPAAPKTEILSMIELTQKMLQDGLEAFVTHDAALAAAVIRGDDAVDALKQRVFGELLADIPRDPATAASCVDWILVSRNLERIGDHATNIAEEVVFIEQGQNHRHLGSGMEG